MMNIISLGAGVQSSTMALMAMHGELEPMPVAALFADTQAEPQATYQYLDWLSSVLPFPVQRVTAGSLLDGVLSNKTLSGHSYQDVPWRTRSGMGKRQCTTQYKILPLYRAVRDIQRAYVNFYKVRFWVGISFDEVQRMKPARVKYLENVFPLIDKRMTRLHCIKWLQDNNYPIPPKSSCVFCPYKGNAEWRALSADDLDVAIKADNAIRTFGVEQYAHRDLVPLKEADFRSAEDAGQMSMFEDECEGMCGV